MAKVLLVDDDVDIQEINRLVLQKRGHEVTVAYSASEAREALNDQTPNIVVLDVMMESFNAGIELAEYVHEKLPEIPIIMLTGIRGKIDPVPKGFELDITKLPIVKFLDKPLPSEKLAAEIDELLNKKG